ncbi:MAG: M28 family peptidase [Melioribacteraceae bacterium]|nr:M28 family peptidase [Melioribacteraceae bacterium]
MIKSKIILALFILINNHAAQNSSDLITNILSEVNIDTLKKTVQILSGELLYNYNSSQVYITNRGGKSTENVIAGDFIGKKLNSFGLSAQSHDYRSNGRNIFAIQPGVANSTEVYIICAHYDNVNNPGADDNASGTAAVLEAARILSQYNLSCSIIYVLFDEEESGLIGSSFFSEKLHNESQQVKGVINLDMIGYDGNNNHAVEIHTQERGNSIDLADHILRLCKEYRIDLAPVIINPGTNRSDHASFWNYGWSAVLLIEELYGGDFNPYYHSLDDVISFFNMDYFYNCARLAIASIASIANETITGNSTDLRIENFSLKQNFPNPFNPGTVIEYSVPDNTHTLVTLKIYDLLGREITTLVNEETGPGNYSVNFKAYDGLTGYTLSSGLYLYTLRAGEYSETKKMILVR